MQLSGKVDATLFSDGVRRSSRQRFDPVEWWRLERVVFGRPEEGKAPLPVYKGIHTVPKEPVRRLGNAAGKKRKRGVSVRATSTFPEQGWDEKTDPLGLVFDFELETEIERRKCLFDRVDERILKLIFDIRGCVHRLHDRSPSNVGRQIRIPEDLWRRRICRSWCDYSTEERRKAE